MRILKYFFLLFLLVFVALCVYIFTQESSYSATQKLEIPLPKTTLFNYVNDYKNWKEFNELLVKDSSTRLNFSKVSMGVGSTIEWKNTKSMGSFQTTFSIQNDSIGQNANWSGTSLKSYWLFKETSKGTEVTWYVSGELDFKAKLFRIFSKGLDSEIQATQKATLENLNKLLSKELNDYSIVVEGVQTVTELYYLQQKNDSKMSEFYSKVHGLIPKMQLFFQENNIVAKGYPMVIIDSFDTAADKVIFNFCMPINEEIFTSPESEITCSKRTNYQAVKVVLKGDYSHSKEAWDKGLEYIKEKKLQENESASIMEIYVKNSSQINRPSQWITEIYIPIKSGVPASSPIPQNTSAITE